MKFGPNARAISLALLVYEVRAGEASGENIPAVVRVSEKLRRPLSTIAGSTGFRALLGRALVLAKAQDPGLAAVRVQQDGSLDGLSELLDDENRPAGVALIAHLLGLLDGFIGTDLALRLVLDVWPDLPGFEVEALRGESNGESGK